MTPLQGRGMITSLWLEYYKKHGTCCGRLIKKAEQKKPNPHSPPLEGGCPIGAGGLAITIPQKAKPKKSKAHSPPLEGCPKGRGGSVILIPTTNHQSTKKEAALIATSFLI